MWDHADLIFEPLSDFAELTRLLRSVLVLVGITHLAIAKFKIRGTLRVEEEALPHSGQQLEQQQQPQSEFKPNAKVQ